MDGPYQWLKQMSEKGTGISFLAKPLTFPTSDIATTRYIGSTKSAELHFLGSLTSMQLFHMSTKATRRQILMLLAPPTRLKGFAPTWTPRARQ